MGAAQRKSSEWARPAAVQEAAAAAKVPRPDKTGRFGKFGGQYVPETLIPALIELVEEYEAAKKDPEFEVGLDRFCWLFSHPSPSMIGASLSIRLPYQI